MHPGRAVVIRQVEALMRRHGVRRMELARVLDISPSALARRLRGEVPFDVDDLFAMAKRFGVDVTTLLKRS